MNSIKKLAVLGGTFNPIHNAHIYLIKQFLSKYKVDKFLLIPTGVPPHKAYTNQVSNKDRLNMCSLAVKDIPSVQVCDIEIKRKGKSYTYETLQELKEIYKEADICFLMGADMFTSFNSWKNPEKILNLATLCVVPRDEAENKILRKYKAQILSLYSAASVEILDVETYELSSTKIRKHMEQKKSIAKLVPYEVSKYIEENSLYQ